MWLARHNNQEIQYSASSAWPEAVLRPLRSSPLPFKKGAIIIPTIGEERQTPRSYMSYRRLCVTSNVLNTDYFGVPFIEFYLGTLCLAAMETLLSKQKQRCLRNITLDWNPGTTGYHGYQTLNYQRQNFHRYTMNVEKLSHPVCLCQCKSCWCICLWCAFLGQGVMGLSPCLTRVIPSLAVSFQVREPHPRGS